MGGVDQKFTAMVAGIAYRKEAVQISEEFSATDWEALQSGEGRLRRDDTFDARLDPAKGSE
jgi:hypothetical protein